MLFFKNKYASIVFYLQYSFLDFFTAINRIYKIYTAIIILLL